jgi:hypothetical protein
MVKYESPAKDIMPGEIIKFINNVETLLKNKFGLKKKK